MIYNIILIYLFIGFCIDSITQWFINTLPYDARPPLYNSNWSRFIIIVGWLPSIIVGLLRRNL